MFYIHFKKIMMGLIVGVFITSNSYAFWTRGASETTCVDNTCEHSSYDKQCYRGDCRVVTKSSAWHR